MNRPMDGALAEGVLDDEDFNLIRFAANWYVEGILEVIRTRLQGRCEAFGVRRFKAKLGRFTLTRTYSRMAKEVFCDKIQSFLLAKTLGRDAFWAEYRVGGLKSCNCPERARSPNYEIA